LSFGPSGRRHLVPGLAEGVDDFVLSGAGGQVGELVLEKDEAKGVFEDAAFGIGGEVLLEVEFLDAPDGFRVVTKLLQNVPGLAGVELFQVVPPPEVTSAIHRVAGTGNCPAAKVLAAGGEAERFRRVRAQPEHPIKKAAGQE
jgi:hypothetical protein